MPATIKDVAKKANVSISTVSRVINSSKPVSDDIKKRVYEVIEELGYSPNPIARSLVMKKQKIIGVIVPDVTMTVIGEFINAIEDIAKTYDYDIILCNTYGDIANEVRYFELLENKQVGGIIFATREINETNLALMNQINIPIVIFDRKGSEYSVNSVFIDQESATFEAVDYLLKSGHKDVMLIRSGEDTQVESLEQLAGYKRALALHDTTYDETLVFSTNFDNDAVYKMVEQRIISRQLPSAIFATSDDMAISAVNAIVDNGLQVPEDCSVIGTYNSKISKIYRPQLTTVSYPIYDMGAIAIRMLIKDIDGKEKSIQKMALPHRLMIRQSTKNK